MRVTCFDHYMHISTVGKKKKKTGGVDVGMLQHLVLVPFGAQFFSVCARQD